MNLFFNFIGDSFRHTVLSKRLYETKSTDINFCNLIAYTFLVSKVISHGKVDQNITNVSDLRDYCPFFAASFATWTNQKMLQRRKDFPLTTSAHWKLDLDAIALIWRWESASKTIGRYMWTKRRQKGQRPMGRLFKHGLAAV